MEKCYLQLGSVGKSNPLSSKFVLLSLFLKCQPLLDDLMKPIFSPTGPLYMITQVTHRTNIEGAIYGTIICLYSYYYDDFQADGSTGS